MTKEPFIAHSEMTNEIYIVCGTEKYLVTEQVIKAMQNTGRLEQPTSEDCVSRQMVKERMIKYGFRAPVMTVTEFIEDELPPVTPKLSTSEDCVSRKAMLNAITEIDNNVNMDIYTNEVREIIKALPPVTPTHKIGYWDKTGGSFRCSECMHMPEFRDIRALKYCPNCGNHMKWESNNE